MTKNNDNNESTGEILLYQTEDGKTRLEVQFQGETAWLSQAQMAELFQTTKQNVSLHIQNIYDEHELERTGTVKESLTVRQEGKRRVSRSVEFYNLDVIISVGYCLKSLRGTQFRIWATRVLREHLVQGYTFNQTRLAERGLSEARQTLDLLARTLQNQALVDDTGRAVLVERAHA